MVPHINTKTIRRILATRETIFKYGIYLPRSDRDADACSHAKPNPRTQRGRDDRTNAPALFCAVDRALRPALVAPVKTANIAADEITLLPAYYTADRSTFYAAKYAAIESTVDATLNAT